MNYKVFLICLYGLLASAVKGQFNGNERLNGGGSSVLNGNEGLNDGGSGRTNNGFGGEYRGNSNTGQRSGGSGGLFDAAGGIIIGGGQLRGPNNGYGGEYRGNSNAGQRSGGSGGLSGAAGGITIGGGQLRGPNNGFGGEYRGNSNAGQRSGGSGGLSGAAGGISIGGGQLRGPNNGFQGQYDGYSEGLTALLQKLQVQQGDGLPGLTDGKYGGGVGPSLNEGTPQQYERQPNGIQVLGQDFLGGIPTVGSQGGLAKGDVSATVLGPDGLLRTGVVEGILPTVGSQGGLANGDVSATVLGSDGLLRTGVVGGILGNDHDQSGLDLDEPKRDGSNGNVANGAGDVNSGTTGSLETSQIKPEYCLNTFGDAGSTNLGDVSGVSDVQTTQQDAPEIANDQSDVQITQQETSETSNIDDRSDVQTTQQVAPESANDRSDSEVNADSEEYYYEYYYEDEVVTQTENTSTTSKEEPNKEVLRTIYPTATSSQDVTTDVLSTTIGGDIQDGVQETTIQDGDGTTMQTESDEDLLMDELEDGSLEAEEEKTEVRTRKLPPSLAGRLRALASKKP